MPFNNAVSRRVVLYILGSLCLVAPVQSQHAQTDFDFEQTAQLTMRGLTLSRQQADLLERQLLQNPEDMNARIQLLGYYFPSARRPDPVVRAKHILWIIEQHPEAIIAGMPEASMNHVVDKQWYGPAKTLWLKQVDTHPKNTAILGNAAEYFLLQDAQTAEKLLLQAQSIEPKNPQWPVRLGQVYALKLARRSERKRSGTERKEAAQQALHYYEQAYALDKTYTGEGGGGLEDLATMAYEAGDYAKAEDYATKLLQAVNDMKGKWSYSKAILQGNLENRLWDYGNAIHHGNLIMGRLALHADDTKKAKSYLMAAGKTPGSPQLDSFGPNMTLAKELLEKGEKQAVLNYFALCGKFWDSPELQQWTKEVRKGEIPDFGGNLTY